MTKGLLDTHTFYDRLTERDRQLVSHLADIEREDANRCLHCGGEDCICCEYYLDRQKWVSPEEMFPYAIKDIPSEDSDEFREWSDATGSEDYQDFVREWQDQLREDFMR